MRGLLQAHPREVGGWERTAHSRCTVTRVIKGSCPADAWIPGVAPRWRRPRAKLGVGGSSGYENVHNQINVKEQREILPPHVSSHLLGVEEFYGSTKMLPPAIPCNNPVFWIRKCGLRLFWFCGLFPVLRRSSQAWLVRSGG